MRRALVLALLPAVAAASGLADHGEDLFVREKFEVTLNGYFRVRGELLNNLDLDRGTTPSGRPLYAVPLGNPNGQLLSTVDMRMRTDLAIYAPFASAAVKLRADLVDNLVLGSTPFLSPGTGNAPTPATTPGQLPSTLVRIKRAYAEALTPIGLVAAGRMGNHWGLGILGNGGDCLDCDRGDAADRIAFITAIAGHLWAVAYDFSAVGPLMDRRDASRSLVFEPSADVRTVNFAVMNVRVDESRERRRKANKATVEYGLIASHRWQDFDVPAAYLKTAAPVALSPAQVVPRGFSGTAFDVWLRLTWPSVRVEAEAAVVVANIAQGSLIPGVLLRDPFASLQWAAALELELGAPTGPFQGGVNAGVASGDPAPGFGAYPPAGPVPQPGELDGAQVDPPRDVRADNFRFAPDYRVDRILFAEIIGTVTDAIYVRPWLQARLLALSSSSLKARVSGTYSRAIYASSTPGNSADLGLELNASLQWENRDGFDVLVEYAALIPFSGLSNPAQNLTATPGQLLRLRLAWNF
ncbi:MAG: hypothetical protein H6Q89_2939 [Myxococcaceae bacterium]|nr:hypothetical protein [Myxococcaceae bacterium]